nr:Uncharacterised protein [Ipomoea batatas]
MKKLLIINLVLFVEKHHHIRDPHLLSQQNVFFSLGHRPIGAGNHQNSPVHLGGSGNHILDVIRVAGAVHVRVVPILGLVLHRGGVNRNPTGSLLRGGVDFVVFLRGGVSVGGQGHGEWTKWVERVGVKEEDKISFEGFEEVGVEEGAYGYTNLAFTAAAAAEMEAIVAEI